MNWRKALFIGSVVFNILFVSVFGYMIMQRGGISYIDTKVSSVLGTEGEEFKSTNLDYLKKQSLYELTPIKVGSTVFLGDSLTAGVEWSELFQSIEYVNRGIPGDNSKGALNRLDEIVESKPSRIFIMIGVNDLHSDGEPSALLDNYNSIIDRIQTDSPDTEIYIQSILPYNPEKYALANTTKMSNELIRNTNYQLKQLSDELEVNFIDLYSLMINEYDELKADYTFDGLHLSGEAYMVWKDKLEKF